MKNTTKKSICLMLCLSMVLAFSSTAFAGTLENGANITLHSNSINKNILNSDDVQVYDFTTAAVIDAFEEVTGKDASTVLSKKEIKSALNSEQLYRAKSSDKNKIVYSEKNKKMDIYLNKSTVKLIVGAGSGSVAVGIVTKLISSLSLPTAVANLALFLAPFIVAEVLGEKLSGDKGIILHYEVVLVEKGEEWGYKYDFNGWEYQ